MINRARIEEKHKNQLPKNKKKMKRRYFVVCIYSPPPNQQIKRKSNYVNRNMTFGFSRKKMNFDMTLTF